MNINTNYKVILFDNGIIKYAFFVDNNQLVYTKPNPL